MSSWIYWQNCIALGKMMCSDPSGLQLILHGEANKCSYQFWVCRETIPSHLTWRLSGRQQAIFQHANWHLIIQKSPSTIPCFARLILIYLSVFPFLLTPSFPVHVENNGKWASNTRFTNLLLLLLPHRIFRWHCYFQNDVSETYLNPWHPYGRFQNVDISQYLYQK